MTALAGIWRFDGGAPSAECARMLAAQAVYGPHGTAHGTVGGVALGRALFRTLPEDRYDRQPLAGGGGRFLLVADVRLDNRDELAEVLGLSRQWLSAMSDADLLLTAWERWEDDVFDRLLGDYAFAIWDAQRARLILARDPLGARPLHYHRGAGFVAFASMPKGLHSLPQVPVGPDEDSVAQLLAVVPNSGSRSYFKGISCVEAGHAVEMTQSLAQSVRHWSPRRETLRLPRAEDYAEALREQFDRAVAARLRGAGHTVAAHLSGGRDSGAVATTAARLLAPSGRSVVGFTAVPREGYDGPDPTGRFGDEGPVAAATAALHANIEHVLVRTGNRGLLDGLDRAFHVYERPMLNPCNQLWFEAINDAARERRLSVLLTGQMGNMTISYSGEEWLTELAGNGRWVRLLQECRALVRAGRATWRGALVGSFGPWIPRPLWHALRRAVGKPLGAPFRYSALSALRRRELVGGGGGAGHLGAKSYRLRRDSWETRLAVLRRFDPGNYNKGVLGAWGIDMRDPTSDRRLIEFCLSVPPEQYLRQGQPVALAVRAFADRLPAEVLEGRRKGLQAIDWHEALAAARQELSTELGRLHEVPEAARALDLARMTRLIANWPQANWNEAETVEEYRLALLRGAAGGHFLRKATRSNA